MTLRSPTVDGEPLFGREEELDAAEWLLAGLADGQGRALVLEGEAGVGKTRLSGAIRSRAAAAGMLVLEGGADELERDRPGRILLALAEQLGVPLVASQDEPDAHGGSRGYALIDAVVDAIEDAAVTRLVVVIVEDLHWADELSLRGIAALVQRLAPLPVALVATRRPSPVPQSLPRVLARLAEAGGRELRIRGLNEEAVGSLISAVTGSPPGPRLAARVRAAAGNPLFVIELLRALDAEGALHLEHGRVETDERALPLGMRDAVTRRLSFLLAETVELLRLATLLGTEFAVSDLAIVAGRSVIDVAARLREPLDAQVLTGAGDSLSFRHDLIREAIYDDIAPAVRRDLHREAGNALAAARAPVAQVARQFALGGRHGDLAAVDWLERAAEEVLALDHGTAVALYEQALVLAPTGWAGRARIEAALLEPLAWCGRVDDARSLAQSLLDRAVSAADEFAIRQGLAAVLATAGDLASAAAENEAAAAVAGAPPHEARILRCLAAGEALLAGRSPEEVRAVAEAAIAEAGNAMDDSLASVAHLALALAAGALGDHAGALEHVRASRRSVEGGRITPRGFVFPQVWEGTFQFYLDRFDDAISDYTVLQRRAERRGEPGLLVHTHSATAAIYFLAGRWDDAVPEIDAAMAVARESGAHGLTLVGHALQARIALGQGDFLSADTHLAAGHRVIEAGKHLFGVDLLLWTQARMLEARGDTAAALALLISVWDQTSTIHGLLQYRNLAPDLVRLALLHGDAERAAAVAMETEQLAARSGAPSARAVALRCRGLVDGNADLLVEAVAEYRRSPRRIELAGACEETANALFSAGRANEAVSLLDEAVAIYLDAGADEYVSRVDSLLRAHGTRRRRHSPARALHGWEALSQSERKIADLVAEGLSNPQIAARLYISRRTVETHLSHVFAKLDISSRAQLAAAVSRQQTPPR